MRLTVESLVALCLLAGCALTPPKPPRCQGDFRPVNVPAQQQTATTTHRVDSVRLCMNGVGHAHQG